MKKYYLIDIRKNIILDYSFKFGDILDRMYFYLDHTSHTSLRIAEVHL